MQGFIPAAGRGTRLKPFTEKHPKALLPIADETLLSIVIRRMEQQGVKHIVINVHHFAEQIISYIHKNQWDVEIVISNESLMLMDTGGGLKQAAPLFLPDEPILIHNVDVISSIDLQHFIEVHRSDRSIATLAVSHRDTARKLLFGQGRRLIGWHNALNDQYLWCDKPATRYDSLAFSGISIIEPALLELLPEAHKPYPIIPEYLRIAKKHTISYFEHDPTTWMDVGKTEVIDQAQSFYNTISKR